MNSKFTIFKQTLSCLTITTLLAACSGGSSSGSNDELTDDGRKPLTQSQCEGQTAFIWLNDSCTLKDNNNVTNVQAIQDLPQQDRDDLITWLTSVEKVVRLHAMVPNWDENEEFVSAGEPVIDNHLLNTRLNGSSLINLNGDIAILGTASVATDSYTQRSQINQTLEGDKVLSKSIQVNFSGNTISIWVNEMEVYTFQGISKLPVIAFVESDSQTLSVERNVDVEVSPNQEFHYFKADLFVDTFNTLMKADDTVKRDVARYIGISDAQGERIVTTTETELASFKTDFTELSTEFYSKQYPQTFDHLADSAEATFFMDESTKEVTVNGYITPQKILPDYEVNSNKLFELSTTLNLELTELDADSVNDKQFSVKVTGAKSTGFRAVDKTPTEFSQAFIERANKLRLAYKGFGSTQNTNVFHFPKYHSITQPLQPLIHSDADSVFKAITARPESYAVFLDYGLPTYSPEIQVTRDHINILNGWNLAIQDLMTSFITGSTEDNIRASVINDLNQLIENAKLMDRYSNVSGHFYESIVSAFNESTQPLDDTIYSLHAKSLMKLAIIRAYYNAPISDSAYLSEDEMLRALKLGGDVFQSSVNTFLQALMSSKTKLDGTTYFDDQIIMNDIRGFIALFENNATLKPQLLAHDELAITLSIDEYIPRLLLIDKDDLTSDKLQQRIDQLETIKVFIDIDELNTVTPVNFKYVLGDLTELALSESWKSTTFEWLKVILDKVYLKSHCLKDTYTEQLACIGNEYMSSVLSEGYLADYGNGTNPYVANADKFIAIRQLAEDLISVSFNTYYDTRLDNKTDDGLWLSCSFDETQANILAIEAKLKDLTARVAIESHPSTFTEEYHERRNIVADIEGIYEDCP